MNYGGFGGSFGGGQKLLSEKQPGQGPVEQPKTMNYGGFGKPKEPISADRAVVK